MGMIAGILFGVDLFVIIAVALYVFLRKKNMDSGEQAAYIPEESTEAW